MNYIVRKSCISLLSGAMYMIGSWTAKQMLEKTKKEITKKPRTNEIEETNPA